MMPLVLALASAVTLAQAKVVPSNDKLTLTLFAGAPIPAEEVRVENGAHGLFVEVPHLNMEEPSRVMGDDNEIVVAQEEPDGKVGFTVPIATGRACGEPFTVTSTPTGLKVAATCRSPGREAPAATVTAPASPRAPAPPPAPAPAPPPVEAQDKLPLPPGLAQHGSTDSASSMFRQLGAAVLLLALAAAAFVFFKRRQTPSRLVQVLESTSLGPRRSLLVVRVGNENLILGSSESGIRLLASRPAGATAAATVRTSATPGLADEPGLTDRVASLFEMGDDQEPNFEDLLAADSHEDSELRRRLSAGFAGTVA